MGWQERPNRSYVCQPTPAVPSGARLRASLDPVVKLLDGPHERSVCLGLVVTVGGLPLDAAGGLDAFAGLGGPQVFAVA